MSEKWDENSDLAATRFLSYTCAQLQAAESAPGSSIYLPLQWKGSRAVLPQNYKAQRVRLKQTQTSFDVLGRPL